MTDLLIDSTREGGKEHKYLGFVSELKTVGQLNKFGEVPGEVLVPLVEDGEPVLSGANGVWITKGQSESIGEVGDGGVGDVGLPNLFKRVPLEAGHGIGNLVGIQRELLSVFV